MHRRPEVMPRIDTIEALAGSLEAPSEWLAFGAKVQDAPPTQYVPIIGEVAAGLWLDVTGLGGTPEYAAQPIPIRRKLNSGSL
jgi:hypothetical protein